MKTNHDMRHGPSGTEASNHGHMGHSWMMMACCIPMLVIAVVLVVTGVASVGFIFAALACTAMMFVMMRAMGGRHGGM